MTDPAKATRRYRRSTPTARLTGVTTPPAAEQTAVGYDGHGNVIRSEFGGAVSTFGYDAQDRLVTLTEPGQSVLRLAYSSVSRVPSEITAPDGSVTRATVTDGLITESIDPAGAKTTYAYDEGRRLSAVTDPLDGVTRYEYDDAGRRTGTVSPLGRAARDKLDPARPDHRAGRAVRRHHEVRVLGRRAATDHHRPGRRGVPQRVQRRRSR
nr:hypothetical protein GCM10020092_074270 [Actinoplanes digitatis]